MDPEEHYNSRAGKGSKQEKITTVTPKPVMVHPQESCTKNHTG
jgi:hypothetical protein